MRDALLCLNSSWRDSQNPVLERGSILLAETLFGRQPFTHIQAAADPGGELVDGVLALPAVAEAFDRALDALQAARPDRVLNVGATCGSEAAPVAWLNERYAGGLAVAWFDAHGDLNTPESSPSGRFHGMALRALLGEGPDAIVGRVVRPLVPEQIVLAGVRDLDEPEREYIAAAGIALAPVGMELVERLVATGRERLYVHVDMDVFNPEDFSDTPMTTPGGPDFALFGECLRALGERFDVVGLGLTEYSGRQEGSARRVVELLEAGGLW